MATLTITTPPDMELPYGTVRQACVDHDVMPMASSAQRSGAIDHTLAGDVVSLARVALQILGYGTVVTLVSRNPTGIALELCLTGPTYAVQRAAMVLGDIESERPFVVHSF